MNDKLLNFFIESQRLKKYELEKSESLVDIKEKTSDKPAN